MTAPAHPVRRVDLNADLGEEITDDDGLLRVVSSANVACGYHAGSRAVMTRVCELAAELGVVVGAQVSYADRANFGRLELDVAPAILREQVGDQVATLAAIAEAAGTSVRYVKPHGALYHRVAWDREQAGALLDASGDLPVLGLPGAASLAMALARGRVVRHEGFPDRAQTPSGGLVPRGEPGAVLHDPAEVAERAVVMADSVDSLCVHGDTPGAVALARRVRERLAGAGWQVASCW